MKSSGSRAACSGWPPLGTPPAETQKRKDRWRRLDAGLFYGLVNVVRFLIYLE